MTAPVPQFMTDAARILYDHWQSVRGDELVPVRAAIDPGALVSMLPYAFMLDMVNRDTAVYRLVGTAHRARFGIEFTGKIWGMFQRPDYRVARTRRLWQAVEQPCGFVATYEVMFSSTARDPIETLLLPLRPNDPAKPPIMIGSSASTQGANWVNTGPGVATRSDETTRFIDIGAGIPDT